jgi:DNA-binding transcriptional MerR regulator
MEQGKVDKRKTRIRRTVDPLVRAYGVGEVEKLSGISRITLHVWDRSGFICPTVVGGGAGTGNRRKYSFSDIVALRVAKRLRDDGISLQALRRVSKYLRERENVENPFAERYLAVHGTDVVMVRKDEVVSLLQSPGQYWLLHLDLEGEAAKLKREVQALAA